MRESYTAPSTDPIVRQQRKPVRVDFGWLHVTDPIRTALRKAVVRCGYGKQIIESRAIE
jgi:hypothetical protein